MSDMYTWLNIMENGARVPFKEGEAVQLSKRCGGGVGQFAGFSPENGTCTINIKGAPQEFRLDDIEAAIDPGASYYKGNSEEQRYGEVDGNQHYLPDKPELQPGQMIRINNIYGQGNGEGYGVFVAYALDGQSAICNVDSENKTIPIEFIEPAPEESDDCFSDTGNDGALSPMSFGDKMRINVEDGKEDVTMEDLEKWMQVIENDGADIEDDAEEIDEGKDKDCDCGSYDCSVCFPDDKDVSEEIIDENEIFDIVYELAEEDEFEDDLDEAYNDDDEEIEEMRINDIEEGEKWNDDVAAGAAAQRKADGGVRKMDPETLEQKRARWRAESSKKKGVREEGPEDEFDTGDSSAEFASSPDAMVDIGDAPGAEGPDPMAGMDKEMGTAEITGGSEDVSDLIAKIAYVQDMGMSMTDRFYDPDKLAMMKPEMIQRIHSKVVGESAGGMGSGGVAIEGTEEDSIGRQRADKETRAVASDELGDFDPNRDFPMESADEDDDDEELDESGKPWEKDEDDEDDKEEVDEGCDDVKEEDEDDLEESWYNKFLSTLEENKDEDEDEEEITEEDDEDESDEKTKVDESVGANRKKKVSEAADPDIVKAMKALFE